MKRGQLPMMRPKTMAGKISFILISALLLLFFYISPSYAFEVAVLKSADIKPYNEAIEGFKESCECEVDEFVLPEIENQDVIKKILSVKPDLILTIGMDALTAVHLKIRLLNRLPVVYAMVPLPPSFISDDMNISGVSMHIPAGRYLDAMLDIFPNAKRIGLVYNPKNLDAFVRDAAEAAQSKGVSLVLKKANKSADVPPLIDGMKDKIDILWMPPDVTVVNSVAVDYILLFSFQNKAPVFTFSQKYVEMGALASLNIVPSDIGKQTAELAKKMVMEKKSASPIRLNARKTVLTINRKVAVKMGMKIRDEIIRKAVVIN